MVGVSKKLYAGVVEYFTDTANKLRETGSDNGRPLDIIEATLDTLNEPNKDNFERMVTLALVSEVIAEATTTAALLGKLGLADDVDRDTYVYGAIIGACNLALTLAGVTTEAVKAYIEEQAVVTEEPALIGAPA